VIRRVALISIHTSPLDSPGSGDAGGMNVYVDALARTLVEREVAVDVFTQGPGSVTQVIDGYNVVGLPAEGRDRAEVVNAFTDGVVDWVTTAGAAYDVIHSHYWLSGWAGVLLGERLGSPLAISFHTLGRVKEATRTPGEPRESLIRIAAESEVVARAECMVASTPADAADLIEHYQASPERICVSPPGVDHTLFTPGDQTSARAVFGLGNGPVVGFVGRIQALKGVDVAIRAVADIPEATLLVVGGPSGRDGEAVYDDLVRLASEIAPERVRFHGPMAHGAVVDAYRASDVVVVPSHAESFGLVALEAMATGVPVVASRVGGLPYVVVDGITGRLVSGHDPGEYSKALRSVLFDGGVGEKMSMGAIERAGEFSWEVTVDRLLELYRGMVD
jgi:D-inositol-3-phosphate glycosyltransferase